MSIDAEQDGAPLLPEVSASRTEGFDSADKIAAAEFRSKAAKRRVKETDSKTSNWAEKLAGNAAVEEELGKKVKIKAHLDGKLEASTPKVRPTKSKKSTAPSANFTLTENQVGVTQTPAQLRKNQAEAQEDELSRDVDVPFDSKAKPKRLRKAPSNLVGQQKGESLSALPTPTSTLSVSIPPITNEAIAFLSNPDAKATDLFKLAADSQAFVQYHITNMQRLEAESAFAHAYLLAKATKHSPRFEKAADALITKLARERPRLVDAQKEPELSQATPATIKRFEASYRAQQTWVNVRLTKPSSSNVGKTLTEHIQENTIESTWSREKKPQLFQKTQLSSPSRNNNDVASVPQTVRTGQRLLHSVENIFQTAAVWLQKKGREIPSASESVPAALPAHPLASAVDRSNIVPDEVARRFLKVDRDYYFLDKTPAFSDRENKLATHGEHPEVVKSLIEIAVARGWDNITVKGTETFRRAAWMEALQSGLMVVGYQPAPLDLAELANKPAKNFVEKRVTKDRPTSLPETNHKPVAMMHDGVPAVDVQEPRHNSDSGTVQHPELLAKAHSFDNDKPSFVIKKHPDLAPAYGVIDAAKKFAESNLPEGVKEEFIGLARRYIMNRIICGEAVVGPKVFLETPKARNSSYPTKGVDDKLPILDRSPRAKEVAREK